MIMLVITWYKERNINLFYLDSFLRNSEVGGSYGGKIGIEHGLLYKQEAFRFVRYVM